jgi:uncharacterized protein (DUF1501 family)
MKHRNGSTRRDFLVRTSCAAMSAAAMQSSFRKFGLMSMLAQDAVATGAAPTNYKALVCLFLAGGNDSNNMLIPNDTTRYNQYAAVRNASGLAIPQAQLHPIASASAGAMGMHPNLDQPFPAAPATAYPNLQTLYNAGKMAWVTNVGSLVQPLTKSQYQSGLPRPFQLFSHSDQVRQQLTSNAFSPLQNGFGGRMADRLIGMNNGNGFPMVTSIAGSTVFGIGLQTRPLAIGTGALNQVLVLNGFTTSPEDIARKSAFDTLRTIDNQAQMIAATSSVTQQALDIRAALVTDPTLTTVFPNSGLGNQLKQVAKVMKLNQTSATLSLNRQIFYVAIGGFDTHQNQISSHQQLYTQIGQALASFYQATVELGIPDKVTLFTLSDFGRTLSPSGNGSGVVGSDHAWGGHHMVMGGAVNGGNLYGQNGGNGTIFPDLVPNGVQSVDSRGRFIPTTSVDTYGATLGTWFGLQAADLPIVFPNINHFPIQNLGFV